MKDLNDHKQAVEAIIPGMFGNIARDFRYPEGTNMAASDQCHVLSKGLYIALKNQGLETRRELHRDKEVWHYLIAHSPETGEPTEQDIITDLNPWQFMEGEPDRTYTFLHGSREEVMDRLVREGAPDYFVALRGISTIQKAHSLTLLDHI